MKKTTKIMSILTTTTALLSISNIAHSKIVLEMFADMTNTVSDKAIKKTIKQFEHKNPNIQIKYTPGGSTYEAIMKTRMAAKKTPDIFSTHGWSVARYANYLEPLNDQPWVKHINPLIKPIITDTKNNNNIYVLPIDVDVSGVIYNVDVVKKAGVNVDSIKTWADFSKACDKIKKIHKVCVQLGTQMKSGPGNYYDWTAEGYILTKNGKSKKELINGTYDFNNSKESNNQFEMLNTWRNKGYLNKDIGSSDAHTWARRMARNKAAFLLLGNYTVPEIKHYNKKANTGFFPIPTNGKTTPYFNYWRTLNIWGCKI